jgi:hypothetical protein
LALRPARHLLWLLDHHTRPTIAGPARGRRRPAAVQIATSSPPADIEAR